MSVVRPANARLTHLLVNVHCPNERCDGYIRHLFSTPTFIDGQESSGGSQFDFAVQCPRCGERFTIRAEIRNLVD